MSSAFLKDVDELARRFWPPLTVIGSNETGSFDDVSVDLQDGHVVWRVVRERSVLRLEAAPSWEPNASFDADLLRRFRGQAVERERRDAPAGSVERLRELLARSMDDLESELHQLRQPVAAAFNESAWETTRRQLVDLGRRRDWELFGRPYPPPNS
jgi:hypothetical protein